MFRNLFNFLVCIGLGVLLCVYVSGLGGLFIIILLSLSFLFSVVLVAVARKTVTASVELSADISAKGEQLEMEIHISKRTILPTSFIEITLEMTPNVTTQHLKKFKLVAARRYGDTVTVPIKTELCGAATVGIGEIKLVDYMGIVSYKVTGLDPDELSKTLRIMPEIRDAGVQAEIIKSTSESAAANEEEDEESDEAAIGLTGIAGYEHRRYEVGDPLKRINWKLSSKKDELMVRLDDKVLTATQDLIFDYPVNQYADRAYYENADRMIEAGLSMLSMLLRQGYETTYTYYLDGWNTLEIGDENGLMSLQEILASIRPMPLAARYEKLQGADSTSICFTVCMGYMTGELSIFSSSGCSLVVSDTSCIGKILPNVWRVNHDFEFTRL